MVHTLKVINETFEDKEVRRFTVNDDVLSCYSSLCDKIWKYFPSIKGKSLQIRWIDSEHDYITMSSDEELTQAILNSDENGMIKLYIKCTEVPKLNEFWRHPSWFTASDVKRNADPSYFHEDIAGNFMGGEKVGVHHDIYDTRLREALSNPSEGKGKKSKPKFTTNIPCLNERDAWLQGARPESALLAETTLNEKNENKKFGNGLNNVSRYDARLRNALSNPSERKWKESKTKFTANIPCLNERDAWLQGARPESALLAETTLNEKNEKNENKKFGNALSNENLNANEEWTVLNASCNEKCVNNSNTNSKTEVGNTKASSFHLETENDIPAMQQTDELLETISDDTVHATFTMLQSMGFANEGGWLLKLVEVKEGNIAEVFNTLCPRQ